MYNNIGKKIKVLAKVCGWITLIGGFLIFFILLGDYWIDEIWYIPFLALLGFISSWPLYGFGDLIENVQKIADSKENNQKIV